MPEPKELPKLGPEFFRRTDESDDGAFYDFPRLTVHIDDSAIAAVSEIYASRLPPSAAILDFMSSWRSHLPESLHPARVTGLGLSRPEMEANPALTEVVVHDVNREPRLPFDDRVFDGAVMTVSVQYLIHPIETFAEVGRVLKPAAPFIVTFSNRMFPTKAVAIWVNSPRMNAYCSSSIISRRAAPSAMWNSSIAAGGPVRHPIQFTQCSEFKSKSGSRRKNCGNRPRVA